MWPFKKDKKTEIEKRKKTLEKKKAKIDKKKKDAAEKSKTPKVKGGKEPPAAKMGGVADRLERGLEQLEKLGEEEYYQPDSKPYEFRFGQGIVNLNVRGKTLADLFENAAEAMFGVMVDLNQIEAVDSKTVEVESAYPADMLKAWLDSLLFHYGVDYLIFSDFDVKITGNKLTGTATGEELDSKMHEKKCEVKNILKDVQIEQKRNGFEAKLSLEI
ncbi:MAG: archease [archaeon]